MKISLDTYRKVRYGDGMESNCEKCGDSVKITYDGGYCEDCAIDNLPTGCGEKVKADRRGVTV